MKSVENNKVNIYMELNKYLPIVKKFEEDYSKNIYVCEFPNKISKIFSSYFTMSDAYLSIADQPFMSVLKAFMENKLNTFYYTSFDINKAGKFHQYIGYILFNIMPTTSNDDVFKELVKNPFNLAVMREVVELSKNITSLKSDQREMLTYFMAVYCENFIHFLLEILEKYKKLTDFYASIPQELKDKYEQKTGGTNHKKRTKRHKHKKRTKRTKRKLGTKRKLVKKHHTKH